MTTRDLFADHAPVDARRIALGEAAFVLRSFALAEAPALLAAVDAIAVQAPLRHMVTPGGFEMSVALTNCGALGWTTDRRGYRYAARDPQTDRPWPPLPECFLRLAREAAAEAGFPGFVPDACLINRYVPGARLSLHQDKDEQDYGAPIVSVSLGIPAVFLWGGHRRTDKTQRVPLLHGDVVVWGGPDRLRYHGVLPLKESEHPLLGAQRINLTLRRAG
ncbi:DNA oxidative demethylase AlkB [Ralstonia solanacearum]|uniref:Alpha-ketoglutarate-dependent dioxygenase AlkB n=1 Tax=Ralstonia solanacearum TaxID=305 RepID=A0AAE3NGN9_RALSL|nr:DNA oxidative demethylase AlkB [Ralstonia solanacearum]MBB6581233.1 DNA oxidative demethylase AlkB [Ralstonia solanacearum]MDB0521223.1 DNA oxidative demethylase AlkB [Ralstonia solanacearum]